MNGNSNDCTEEKMVKKQRAREGDEILELDSSFPASILGIVRNGLIATFTSDALLSHDPFLVFHVLSFLWSLL